MTGLDGENFGACLVHATFELVYVPYCADTLAAVVTVCNHLRRASSGVTRLTKRRRDIDLRRGNALSAVIVWAGFAAEAASAAASEIERIMGRLLNLVPVLQCM